VADADRIGKIQRLEDENARLKLQLAQKDDQLRELGRTVQSMRGLKDDRALEKMPHADRIEIERLSGGYDDDRDGIDEGVAVYIYVYDQHGGTLRAAGSATVTLVDLSNPADAKVVGELKYTADELAKHWYGAFMTSHYTLKVPWSGNAKRPPAKNITVMVAFTDLLTGRALEAQRLVTVTGQGVPSTQSISE